MTDYKRMPFEDIEIHIKDDRAEWQQQFWKAFDQAFATILTDDLREVALAAGKAEHRKWIGHMDWAKPIAATALAMLEAINEARAKAR